jgi:quinol monooxygenase YgiN
VYVVVNHLRLREPLRDEVLRSAREDVLPPMQDAGCRSLELVRVDDLHWILLMAFDEREALNQAATTIGGPWMNEHVGPLLASPTERSVGEIVVSL